MKVAVSKLLVMGLGLLWPAVVQAQFTFTTNNGAITITGYAGSGGVVAIPDTINGYPVTSIGDFALFRKNNLTGVGIPSSVTNIGTGAFALSTNLNSIVIPGSVISLGDHVFDGCAG